MSNTFGQLFRVTTFGESHGGGIGVVVDGCPPRIEISEAEIQRDLDRRRPGQSKLTTQRKEEDRCELLSGVFEGRTLGTPIAILVKNKDARPEDYSEIARKFRPSHADYTYEAKYGIRNWQGGGRASAALEIRRALFLERLDAVTAEGEHLAFMGLGVAGTCAELDGLHDLVERSAPQPVIVVEVGITLAAGRSGAVALHAVDLERGASSGDGLAVREISLVILLYNPATVVLSGISSGLESSVYAIIAICGCGEQGRAQLAARDGQDVGRGVRGVCHPGG